jgi:hypothetical protein
LVALGGAGTAAGAAGIGIGLLDTDGDGDDDDGPLAAHDRETAVALADVLYPSAVDGVASFVETYVEGLATDRPDYAGSVAGAVDALDEYCETWWDNPYVALPPDRQEQVPRGMGLAAADPRPDGADRERVRYYLVDELLYALYASPTGGRLLGIENPPGHPGGIESYQRGPDSE